MRTVLIAMSIICGLVAEEVHKERSIETFHTVTIDEVVIPYKATLGSFILKDSEGKPQAEMVYTSYEREGSFDERPITFCFNGGPGSASLWLHLGVLGPRRVSLVGEGYPDGSNQVIENPYSLLDVTDLVFIDPVSTGYSKALYGDAKEHFYGVEEDIRSIAEFIRLYVTRNHKWGSPKFLLGESYGTTRAVGLASHLQEEMHMNVDGIFLVSNILNFLTLWDIQEGNDLPYILYLPSFTATAWYHKKLSEELLEDREKTLREVELFATGPYANALMQGDKLSQEEREEMIQKLSYYTGLSTEYLDYRNMRVPIWAFAKELLREEKKVVGRFDSRYKGIDRTPFGDAMQSDPSAEIFFKLFASSFNDYLSTDLGCTLDDTYKIISREVNCNWNFKTKNESFGRSYPNMSSRLRNAMHLNPKLQVFVANGYYDLATPYFASDYTMNHLNINKEVRDHITMAYYDAGHMMYVHPESLIKMRGDMVSFIEKTLLIRKTR